MLITGGMTALGLYAVMSFKASIMGAAFPMLHRIKEPVAGPFHPFLIFGSVPFVCW